MPNDLQTLIELARGVVMSPEDREAQRISFAYGNTKIENDNITMETVVRASAELRGNPHGRPPVQ